MTVWTGTLPTWVSGEDILAADLDQMTDALAALTDAWTTYTVAWTSSGTQPAIVNGIKEGRYFQANKIVGTHIRLVMGSSTTFGTGQYFLSLPVAARISNYPMTCYMLDSGTANKAGIAFATSGLDTVAMVQNTTDVAATAPHTWANLDQIHIFGFYEVA